MKSILVIYIAIFYSLAQANAQKDEHGHDHAEQEAHAKDTKANYSDKNDHSDHDGQKEDHDHKDDEESHDEHDEHEDHDKEDDGEAHGDEAEEGSSVVGPEKGILAKSKEGFKLAPEAMKTFDLKTESIKTKVIEILRPSLVEIKNDKFIYRIRDGWIKKVTVKILKKDSQRATVDISDFKDGDQIITNGVGFVRTAELVAEEGVSHGHSH